MINISIKSQPHRAYGFRNDFFSIFFLFFGILVSMAMNKQKGHDGPVMFT